FMLSGAFVMVFSAALPAESAFVYFGIIDPGTASTVSDFKILRDGTLRVFDISRMQGIVSIPSFHTMLAVFFIYTLRNVRLLFAIALPLNLVLIASTPPQGGHYLADVVCGLLGSALAIWMLRYVTARYGSRHAATASAPLVSALPELTPLSRATWRK
ncbi:MAG: phosphatase PAP2 family protein, partial [Janthinobacterium lividum]